MVIVKRMDRRFTAGVWVLLCLLLVGGPRALAAEPDVVFPGKEWQRAVAADVGLDEARLRQARDYALSAGGSGYITRHGRLVMTWGDVDKRYDLKSTTKSIGATALGVAILDGKIRLEDKASQLHAMFGTPPAENTATGWLDQITIRHLVTQTAGFAKPGGYERLLFAPGTKWSYSDGGPNWLAECVTLAYRQDVQELMFDRVFTPLGIERSDLVWRANSYRPREIAGIARREFGSGVSANVDAMARIGYLYLRGGQWNGQRLLPADFVAQAGAAVKEVVGLEEQDAAQYGNASDHYGYLWWNNADGTIRGLPRDAFWSWGLYDSLIVVIPSLDIVASRTGSSWKRASSEHYQVLAPFLEPIAAAVQPGTAQAEDDLERDPDQVDRARQIATAAGTAAPYPPSPIIATIDWAPASSIVRQARGGDNWPMTWGDDDALYTAYGDGRGFEPMVPGKLSLGLARIEGGPDHFQATNLRAPSIEVTGDGAKGKKASGMLMVDGVLYMWLRNARNAQLAWSADHGRSWTLSDWRMETSFGCPTFLNFGRNYAGARDEFVYVYSHDSDSAYQPADRMVLARAARDRLRELSAYEYFAGLDSSGQPQWTKDVQQRGTVFTHQGKCYRSGISYNAALERYLWVQILPGGDTRFAGGLGVYDAPQPWGPWTTVYFAAKWDVGPGETASLPPKWISSDGRTVHLVFSGDDHFSVRRGQLKLTADPRPAGPR